MQCHHTPCLYSLSPLTHIVDLKKKRKKEDECLVSESHVWQTLPLYQFSLDFHCFHLWHDRVCVCVYEVLSFLLSRQFMLPSNLDFSYIWARLVKAMREKQTTVKNSLNMSVVIGAITMKVWRSLKKPLVHCLDRKEEEKEPSFASTFTKLI